MDYLQIIGAAITGGATLGAIVAGFFAQRQKSLVTLLREGNNDYKERVEQLETERDQLKKDFQSMRDELAQLKKEKAIPLEKLTKLIIAQHSENQESIMALTQAIVGNTSQIKINNKKGKNK